ncbi:cytochrome c oxidase subunit II transmembrane domain-containing protein [Priestia megaterium]
MAQKEYQLIIFSIILCTIVVIPVLGLLVYIVLRYRDKPGNKAPYRPDWDDSKRLEFIWWGIPIIIIGILGFATAKTTYDLVDPPKRDVKPLTIEVTSLDWKWLFQYPDQDIATVNYVNIPKDVPVQFVLTSDAPMNSFWYPSWEDNYIPCREWQWGFGCKLITRENILVRVLILRVKGSLI